MMKSLDMYFYSIHENIFLIDVFCRNVLCCFSYLKIYIISIFEGCINSFLTVIFEWVRFFSVSYLQKFPVGIVLWRDKYSLLLYAAQGFPFLFLERWIVSFKCGAFIYPYLLSSPNLSKFKRAWSFRWGLPPRNPANVFQCHLLAFQMGYFRVLPLIGP